LGLLDLCVKRSNFNETKTRNTIFTKNADKKTAIVVCRRTRDVADGRELRAPPNPTRLNGKEKRKNRRERTLAGHDETGERRPGRAAAGKTGIGLGGP